MTKIHKTKTRPMQAGDETAQQMENLKMEVSMLKDSYFQLIKLKADLERSETRYRMLSENQADVIWAAEVKNISNLLDQIRKGHLNAKSLESKIHPRFTYVNSAIYSARGYTPEEFLKMNMKNTMPLDSYKKFIHVLAENIFYLGKTKPSFSYSYSRVIELEVTRKDGTIFWVEMNLKCNQDPQGQIIGIIGVNRNITERKIAADLLKKEKEWSDTIFQSVPNIIIGLGEKSKILLFNKFAENFTGYKSEEVMGKSWIGTFIPKELRQEINGVWNKIAKHKSIEHHYINSIITKKGEEKFISWNNTVLIENGKFKMVLSVGEDVTERRKAEEALQESEKKFRAIFEGGADGILIANIKIKRFIMTNSTMCRFLGYREDELLRLGVPDIHPKASLSWVQEQFMKLGKGIVKVVQDIPCLKKDGSVVYADVAGSLLVMNGIQYNVGFFRDSTVRKSGEDALVKAEERYRAVFESSSDAIMMLDQKGFFDCNKASLKMFGIKTVKEFRKLHLAKLSPPKQPDGTDSLKLSNEKIAKAYKTGSNFFPWVHRRQNGEDFPADVSLNLMELEGKLVLQAMVRDVTERRKAEENLKESKTFLDKIINTMSDPVFVKDDKCRFVLVNDAEVALTGLTRESQLGKTTLEQYAKNEADKFLKNDLGVLNTGKENVSEEHLTNKHGKLLTIVTKKTRYMDLSGNKFIVGVIRDITERKKEEEVIRESEAKFRAVVEHITDVVFTTDLSGIVTFITPNVSDFGYAPKDIIGRHFMDFVHTEDVKRIVADFEATIKGGPHTSSEFRIRRKNGSYIVVEEMDELIRESGKPVHLVGTFRDIAERKLAEEELKKKVGQMEFIGRTNLKRHKEMLEMKKEIERLKAEIEKLKG